MFIYKWYPCIKNPSFINENSKRIIPYSFAFINKHAIWSYFKIRLNLVQTSNMGLVYTGLYLSHCYCLRFRTLKSKWWFKFKNSAYPASRDAMGNPRNPFPEVPSHFVSTNPQYNNKLSIELQVQYMKIPSSEHGENMLCTEIVYDIQNNLCRQHVLMFCKNRSFWQRFTCIMFIVKDCSIKQKTYPPKFPEEPGE